MSQDILGQRQIGTLEDSEKLDNSLGKAAGLDPSHGWAQRYFFAMI